MAAAEGGLEWWVIFTVTGFLVVTSVTAASSAPQETLEQEHQHASIYINGSQTFQSHKFQTRMLNFLWQLGRLFSYEHVWPEMTIGWKIVVGTIIGFLGSAFGTVGGVGGGGIFVPMLTLIIGFDQKSSTAISKCMITGAAISSVFYNLRLRHPTADLPLIDYDLALLFQPMLVLGISIGVAFNVIFANWMITVLLIITFLATSSRAFFKGIETWKKETIVKKEAARRMQSNGDDATAEVYYKPLPSGPSNGTPTETGESKRTEVSIFENLYWKELLILFAVWIIILALQIAKNYTTTCSAAYWAYNLLQVSSATATFAMTFSASLSVVEYYLLKRFPIPYALYFTAVATFSALVGQYVVRKVVSFLGRASIIIFILAFTIFVSAISLGGVGIVDMIEKIKHKEYMGFENICTYDA